MSQIIYNEELIMGISKLYAECEANTRELIINIQQTRTILLNNYAGQGELIVIEATNKVEEHLELLQLCYEQIGLYITNALTSMQEADKKRAKEIGK